MARKTQQETQKTYRQLIDSALTLFQQQGVANTSMEQIARNARMTRGAVYWHFENKQAIIQALWEVYVFPLIRQFRDELKTLDSRYPAKDFREILLHTFDKLLMNRESALSVRILLRSVEFCEQQTQLQRVSSAVRSDIHEALVDAIGLLRRTGQLSSDLPIEILAAGLMSYLHGLLDLNLAIDSPVCIIDEIPQLLDLFLDGMLQQSAEGAAKRLHSGPGERVSAETVKPHNLRNRK